ncbi:hypothetical protein H8B06_19210 [Sphingobacterium sp. DN00404]|uniref:Uncharacterized protein n=1 Tax=Sphingobacterium micropteri TaxID=2763501 RepID=A0ABR7YUC4_9SPHI|nr:hypothetical protein [Sphingobacterium micropteri]MBD1434958.1 hypothetical protein [Sphingobacterium micropteri]
MNILYKLRLSSNRALLFNVISSVKYICVKLKKEKLILSVYCERELTEDEKDIYYAVAGEIIGDFVELDDSLTEVEFIVSNKKYEKSDCKGELVYARYE